MEDSRIVELFGLRDETAIREAEAKYGAGLKRLAARLLGSREDAEESLNDTLLRAWNAIPPAKPKRLGAYLAKICRYVAFERLDARSAQKRSAEVVELTAEMELCIPDPRSETAFSGEELGRILDEFLSALPKEQRLIFLRRYWYADTVAEIAARFSIGESKVKTTLHRLRSRLKEHLEQEGVGV